MESIFDLEINANRPIIKLDYIFKGCTALLDTGALLPVWTKEVELLERLGALLHQKNVSFSGFGGVTYGDICKINFKFDKIYYPDMPIIAYQDDNIPGYFLFSATMFNKFKYTVDNVNKKLFITIPDNQVCYNLSIIDSNGKKKILVNQ